MNLEQMKQGDSLTAILLKYLLLMFSTLDLEAILFKFFYLFRMLFESKKGSSYIRILDREERVIT